MTGFRRAKAFVGAAVILITCDASVLATAKHKQTRHDIAVSMDEGVRSMIGTADGASNPAGKPVLLSVARLNLGNEEAVVRMEVDDRSIHATDDGIAAAQSRIAIAEEERKIGCPASAKKDLLAVLDIYVGAGYAAPRQRAQVAIDDLRSDPQTTDAENCKDLGT